MNELENLSISYVIKLKQWFDHYVDSFIKDNFDKRENLELKRVHTYNVCKESLKIMQYYRKNQDCSLSAYIIALFHDIGRFEQFAVYNTFNDKISKDHAELSIEIITRNELFKSINSYAKNIIIKSIQNHNKAHIPVSSDYKINFLSKVIRDADKLDIYRIITQNYTSEKPNDAIFLGLEQSDKVSKNIYHSILNKHCASYQDLNTVTDLKILHLSWVFDINFIYTLEKIKKASYLEKIYNTLPKNTQTQLIFKIIKDYIDKKLRANKQ